MVFFITGLYRGGKIYNMKDLSIENELNYAKKRYEFTKELESIFVRNDYIQIKPTIFEDYDGFKAINKRIDTKSMVKVVGEKILVLRPDITTNIIKSLIPRWEKELVLKLFYNSTVYKNEGKEGIKEIRECGCEYLGEPSIEADREVVNLAFNIFRKFTDKFLLEIGSGNYIDGFVEELNISEEKEREFKKLLYRKNKPELEVFAKSLDIRPELKEVMLNLLTIRGTLEEVTEKAKKYFTNDRMKKGCDLWK